MRIHENKTSAKGKSRDDILIILHIYRRISTILTSYELRLTDATIVPSNELWEVY